MTKLDAINVVLSAVGLEGINDAVDTQGDLEVAQVGFMLEQARKEILTQNQFYFNTVKTTWAPDANDEVRVPTGVLWWQPQNPAERGTIVERVKGDPLIDRETNTTLNTSVDVVYIQDTSIESVPDSIALWIAWRAAEIFSFKLNGTEQNLTFIRAEKIAARAKALNTERVLTDGMSGFDMVRKSYLY